MNVTFDNLINYANGGWGKLYCSEFVTSTEKDTDDISKSQTEIVAKWLCSPISTRSTKSGDKTSNFKVFSGNIPRFFRGEDDKRRSYNMIKSHSASHKTKGKPTDERQLAIKMLKSNRLLRPSPIGTIIDREVPLYDHKYQQTAEIDLISYDEATNRLYLLELKRPNSKETLLRCILEIFTYFKTIGDKAKFLRDFTNESSPNHYIKGINSKTKFVLCPMIFNDAGRPMRDFKTIDSRYYLKKLISLISKDIRHANAALNIAIIDKNNSDNLADWETHVEPMIK